MTGLADTSHVPIFVRETGIPETVSIYQWRLKVITCCTASSSHIAEAAEQENWLNERSSARETRLKLESVAHFKDQTITIFQFHRQSQTTGSMNQRGSSPTRRLKWSEIDLWKSRTIHVHGPAQ